MSLRYYPTSKIKANKTAKENEFLLGGSVYSGKYYETFDGKFFTGANPIIGTNKQLQRITPYINSPYITDTGMSRQMRKDFVSKNNNRPILNPPEEVSIPGITIPPPTFKGEPTSYFPVPLPEDYTKGSITRYFAKRINSKGYVTEISEQEYIAIQNGKVPYDVSNYLTIKIFWKITGPLNQKRVSQYDIRAGIIDTNKRLDSTRKNIKSLSIFTSKK